MRSVQRPRQRPGRSLRGGPGVRTRGLFGMLVLALASSAGGTPGNAQGNYTVGGREPSVSVNIDVLNALGQAPAQGAAPGAAQAPRAPGALLPPPGQGGLRDYLNRINSPALQGAGGPTPPAAAIAKPEPPRPPAPRAAAPAQPPAPVAMPQPKLTAPVPLPAPVAKAQPAPQPAPQPPQVAAPTPPTPPTPPQTAATTLQNSPPPAAPRQSRLVPTSKVEPTTRPQAALQPPPAPGAAMNAPQGGAIAGRPVAAPGADPGADPGKADAQMANRSAPGNAATAVVGDGLRVVFPTGSTELPRPAIAALDQLAASLVQDSERRVQLRAYAGAKDENASQSRRVALFRALAVRSYLIERGVRSTRMDIRALGNKYEEEPADRVDILPVTP